MNDRDSLIGSQLGNIRIESLLGSGGMAAVYLGWDVNLQRRVAVKVIADRYRDDPAFAGRFLREAQAVAGLQHPNIVHIYHAGEHNGTSYFVMKYVQGTDLRQWLRAYLDANKLPPQKEVLRICRSIASALDYAHQNGVIHRDVKPSNVLLAEDGRVVLTDFGLAMNVTHETMGEVFGSPQYISPEQARKSSYAVPQSDLYSLGVMLYEMLTGHLPFDDPSPASLAIQHITREPPSPRQFNPAISPAVEAVLLKALRKTPQERYQSGAHLMKALEQALTASDTVPAAAYAPPADTRPAQTSAEIPAVGSYRPPYGAEAAYAPAVPVGEPMPEPPSQPQAGYAGGGVTRPLPVNRRRSSSDRLFKWGSGCIFLLAMCGVLFVIAMNASSPLAAVLNPFGGLPAGAANPTQTASPTLEPLPTDQPADPPTDTPTEMPTNTPEPSPTDTPVPTDTPEPTATLEPTPTSEPVMPPPGEGLVLMFARNGEDGLYVVNLGPTNFPLAPLHLSNVAGEVWGEDWKLDTLEPGKCVVIWKNDGDPKLPKGLTCDLVGEQLTPQNGKRFWIETFEIAYGETRLSECIKDDKGCLLEVWISQLGG